MQDQYTKEILEAKTVKELRAIAREMAIKNITRDGESLNISYARKSEVIEVILAAQTPTESESETETETETKIRTESEELYPDEVRTVEKLTDHFYKGVQNESGRWEMLGLMEIHIRNLTSGDPYSTINDFAYLVSEFRPAIEQVVMERTEKPLNELNVNTLLAWKSKVLKAIERKIKASPGDSTNPQKKELYALFDRFYAGVAGAFKSLSNQRYKTSKENLKHRYDDAVEIQVSQLVAWATDRVTNLPEKSSGWSEVAIAVMILTGRRQSEVMCSAQFETTDSDSHLMFSGQLKRHIEGEVPAFEIPVLGQAANGVVEAVKWLEEHGKRESTPRAAHNRFSRYLNEKAKSVCGYIVSPKSNWYETTNKKGKSADRRKCHLFRQIYGQVAIEVFYPREKGMGRKAKSILGEIMGHADTATSLNHAADCYDADVFVTDADQLK